MSSIIAGKCFNNIQMKYVNFMWKQQSILSVFTGVELDFKVWTFWRRGVKDKEENKEMDFKCAA